MSVPNCFVIIPDGNRRWAKSTGKTASEGYARGLLNGRRIASAAFDRGIKHVVFLCATEENMRKRPKIEKYQLYGLFERELRRHVREALLVRLYACGSKNFLSKELMDLKERAEEHTDHYEESHCTLLFAYDGLTETTEALKKIRNGPIAAEIIRETIWTKHLPNVDLVIRTGHGRRNTPVFCKIKIESFVGMPRIGLGSYAPEAHVIPLYHIPYVEF